MTTQKMTPSICILELASELNLLYYFNPFILSPNAKETFSVEVPINDNFTYFVIPRSRKATGPLELRMPVKAIIQNIKYHNPCSFHVECEIRTFYTVFVFCI